MNKAVVLLTGTPSSKSKFVESAKTSACLWNVDLNNFLGSRTKGFYWNGELCWDVRGEGKDYEDLTYDIFELIYTYFQENETEEDKKNILLVDGASRSLSEKLVSDYGSFKIHISDKDVGEDASLYDMILCENSENFDSEINRLFNVLTKDTSKV